MVTVSTAWTRSLAAALGNLIFPEDCRICGIRLVNFFRIPVCTKCLDRPEPFEAEFFCASCGTPFFNDAPLDEEGRCGLCRHGLAGFDAVFSVAEYDGRVRKLVQLFKYGKVKPLGRRLSEWMRNALPRDQRFDVLVATPMHWTRRWSRGFNQAEVLAACVSDRTGLPVVRPLSRGRRTKHQAGLTNSQRRLNVAGAFVLRSGEQVRDRHVLLVDDVFTTGATAAACARLLKRAGAKRVSVLTVARADRRKSTLNFGELT